MIPFLRLHTTVNSMEAFMLFDYQGNSLKSGVYKLTNLSNNRIECLTEFAKEHGLNMKCLWKLLKGKTPSTRGWRLLK